MTAPTIVDESTASVRGDGEPRFLEVLDDGVLFNEMNIRPSGFRSLDTHREDAPFRLMSLGSHIRST
jgi:hypothetical protein